MKNKRLFILVGILFLISLYSLLTPTHAFDPTIVDGDSYVCSSQLSSNFGDDQEVYIGKNYTAGYFEGYFYFNLTNKPTSFVKAELYLTVLFLIGQPFSVNVILIEEAWDESTITWDTKPAHGEILLTKQISDGGQNRFTITDYVNGDNLSICLNLTMPTAEFKCLWAGSSETVSEEHDPQIVWTISSGINGFPLFLSMIGLGIICFIQFRHYKLRQHNSMNIN